MDKTRANFFENLAYLSDAVIQWCVHGGLGGSGHGPREALDMRVRIVMMAICVSYERLLVLAWRDIPMSFVSHTSLSCNSSTKI